MKIFLKIKIQIYKLPYFKIEYTILVNRELSLYSQRNLIRKGNNNIWFLKYMPHKITTDCLAFL